jgi:hypothetical protein
MVTTQSPAPAELLGVLADMMKKDEWDQASWLGPDAWLACPLEVAGGLWLADGENDDGLGVRVARELERRNLGPTPVICAKRVLPGQGTILVWYRHLN